MAISKALDTAIPQGSASPTSLDTFIQDTKEGFRERLAIDHEFDISSGTTVEAGDEAGRHKHVSFAATESSPALPSGAVGYLWVSGDPEELWYKNDTNSVQLTSGSLLVQPTVDDTTIELDGSSQLSVLLPSAGSDTDQNGSEAILPCMVTGTYTGSGAAGKTLTFPGALRYLVIRQNVGTSKTAVHAMVVGTAGSGTMNAWGGGSDGASFTSDFALSNSDKTLTFGDGDSRYNAAADYTFVAWCERA